MRVHADIANLGVSVNPPKFDKYWQIAHQARYDRMLREQEAYIRDIMSPTNTTACPLSTHTPEVSPTQSVSPCVRPRRPLSVMVA